MKDAGGHGSDGRGGSGQLGPRADALRKHFGATTDQWNAHAVANKMIADRQARSGEQHTKALADQHGIPTHAMSAAGQKKFGPFASAISGFREKYGPPANKGQLARIARFHKAVGRG